MILVLTCAAFGTAQQIDWSRKALQSERSRAYDALHYRIAIRLDLDQKSFEGETTISLTSLRDGLETCILDAEEFKVTKVASDFGEPLQFEQTEKELKL
jgi:aminopeptidase N